MRYLLAIALLAGTASAQSAKTPVALPQAGSLAKVYAQFEGAIPAAKTEDAYAEFMLAVKSQQGPRVLKLIPEKVALLKNETAVQVESVMANGKDLSKAGQQFPSNIPAVMSKLVTKGKVTDTRYWIPLTYFADPRGEPHPAEKKFPVLFIYPDTSVVPEPGMKMIAYDTDGEVLMAAGRFQYEAMIKALEAGDQKGLEELAKKKHVAWIPSGTEVLIIERHTNQFIGRNTHPVEARILAGPFEGQTCWFQEKYTLKFVPKLTSYREAERAAKGEATKAKAKTGRRR